MASKDSANMANEHDNLTVDVRGEVCPGPLLKAVEAMKSALNGQSVELLTDFLPAVLTVTNAALKDKWDIQVKRRGVNQWALILTKSTESSEGN